MLRNNSFLRDKVIYYLSTRTLYNLTDENDHLELLENELFIRQQMEKPKTSHYYSLFYLHLLVCPERHFFPTKYNITLHNKEIKYMNSYFGIKTYKRQIFKDPNNPSVMHLSIGKNLKKAITILSTLIKDMIEKHLIIDNLNSRSIEIDVRFSTYYTNFDLCNKNVLKSGDDVMTFITPHIITKGEDTKLIWRCHTIKRYT